MTPFQSRPGYAYKTHVMLPMDVAPEVTRRRRTCSTGTNDRIVATAVEAMLASFSRRREWAPVIAILTDRYTLAQVYDFYETGVLDERLAAINDVDLSPMVDEWNGRGKKGTTPKYVRQVRQLVTAGKPFPRSRWRRSVISAHLAGLGVSNPTKNRHRAALMQFGKWLLEREIVDTNPVRDVQGFGEHDPRMVWYTREEARSLIATLPQPYQALEALMVGTGMEWQACERLRRSDVDLEARTVFARGGKNRWRTRQVRVTEDWCWPFIEAHVATLTPNAPVFPMSEKMALVRHHAAAERVHVHDSTLHDWRHSYAIWNRQDGVEDAKIKGQLGHAPGSRTLETVYAAYRPKVTKPVTTPPASSPSTHPKQRVSP